MITASLTRGMCTGAPVPATTISQQADSLPWILNRQTAKTWVGTVPWPLKTSGGQVSGCPRVTLPPGLSRRPPCSHGAAGERWWGRSSGTAAFKPCQGRARLVPSVPKTSPSCLCAEPRAGRAAGPGGRPGELGRAAEPAAPLDPRDSLRSWSRRERSESPTSTLPGVGLRRGSAHPHHPHLPVQLHRLHPACSPSPSSSCLLTLAVLSLHLQRLSGAQGSSATQIKKAFLFHGAQCRAGMSAGLLWGTAKAGLS